jgi:hypothetical protein
VFFTNDAQEFQYFDFGDDVQGAHRLIGDTVEIEHRLKPLYNFKAVD